jgi:hypothetical protein
VKSSGPRLSVPPTLALALTFPDWPSVPPTPAKPAGINSSLAFGMWPRAVVVRSRFARTVVT